MFGVFIGGARVLTRGGGGFVFGVVVVVSVGGIGFVDLQFVVC